MMNKYGKNCHRKNDNKKENEKKKIKLTEK